MIRILRLLILVLGCQAAFGKIVIPTDYIQVTPTNATNHVVLLSYGPTNDFVTVIMPYAKAELPFYDAVLECTNSLHHFSLPISCIHPSSVAGQEDVILISFRMDRGTARECTLSVTFRKGLDKATVCVFPLKDFIPKGEAPPGK